MKRIYILLFSCIALALGAQTERSFTFTRNHEGKLIVMPKYVGDFSFTVPKTIYTSYTPATVHQIRKALDKFVPESALPVNERPMDMNILSAAYRPLYDEFTHLLERASPMALDFREHSLVPVADDFALLTTGSKYTWPGLGGITQISSELMWGNDRLMLSGGLHAARYFTPYNRSPGFLGGVNASATYKATDWLRLKAWGSYSIYDSGGQMNPYLTMNSTYPQKAVGGAVEFHFNDHFGVGMGVQYEFNPFKRKMERQTLVYPIFGK